MPGMTRFVVRTEPVRIEAAVDLVWAILTDLDEYGEWNPLTPEVQTDFTVGSPIDELVTMGRKQLKVSATVSAFEPSRLIAFGGAFGARWCFGFVREQHLEPVGANSCRYHNVERLTGVCAPLVFFFLGTLIRRNYTAVAMELKRRAESGNHQN